MSPPDGSSSDSKLRRQHLRERGIVHQELHNLLLGLSEVLKTPSEKSESITLLDALAQTGKEHWQRVFAPHAIGFHFATADQMDGPFVTRWKVNDYDLEDWPWNECDIGAEPRSLALNDDRRCVVSHHRTQRGNRWALVAICKDCKKWSPYHAVSFRLVVGFLEAISSSRERGVAKAEAMKQSLLQALDEHQLIMGQRLSRLQTEKRRADLALMRLDLQLDEELRNNKSLDSVVADLTGAMFQVSRAAVELEEVLERIRPSLLCSEAWLGSSNQLDATEATSVVEISKLLPARTIAEKFRTGTDTENGDQDQLRATYVRTHVRIVQDALAYFHGLLRVWANPKDIPSRRGKNPRLEMEPTYIAAENKVVVEIGLPEGDLDWEQVARFLPAPEDGRELARWISLLRERIRKQSAARNPVLGTEIVSTENAVGPVHSCAKDLGENVAIELSAKLDEKYRALLRDVFGTLEWNPSEFRGGNILAASAIVAFLKGIKVDIRPLPDYVGVQIILPKVLEE